MCVKKEIEKSQSNLRIWISTSGIQESSYHPETNVFWLSGKYIRGVGLTNNRFDDVLINMKQIIYKGYYMVAQRYGLYMYLWVVKTIFYEWE